MSSESAPFGLAPVYHPSGIVRPKVIKDGIASGYATALYKGCPVKLVTGGTIELAAVGDAFVGAFLGVRYETSDGVVISNKWTASSTYTAGTCEVLISDDPQIVYRIQADGSIAQAGIGDQADFVNPGTGDSTTGLSSAQIDATLVGAASNAQLRIVGLSEEPDNEWGDSYTTVLVQVAEHQYVADKAAI